MIDISVIIVSYNHEKYISKTLDSILSQKTYYSMEILVGDDCSTDGTGAIIEDYEKRYPEKIFRIQRAHNMGPSANLYELLTHARGEYLAFCEGDDYWNDVNRIQRDVSFLKQNYIYSGVCGRTKIVDEHDDEISIDQIDERKRFWVFDKEEYGVKDFENWKMPGHISALTIKNFILNKSSNCTIIRDAHRMVGDRTIVMLSVLNGNIKCVGANSSSYRFRINSINHMSNMEKMNLRLDDFKMICNLEDYTKQNYAKEFSLKGIKRDRLIGATVVWLKKRDKANWDVVVGIIKLSHNKIYTIGLVLYVIAIKMIFWKIFKRDRRL